ncbi:hypothetical protein EYF80_011149 [Liparis tanakae]|uniref:Uncharacterized protein n=1 Tax=Liparis tanakae TaxID=230148 RepID=A0A4Z2IM60_9TELE|nr:hypothetical protein EYF80_011149 [Liparis tanakae]
MKSSTVHRTGNAFCVIRRTLGKKPAAGEQAGGASRASSSTSLLFFTRRTERRWCASKGEPVRIYAHQNPEGGVGGGRAGGKSCGEPRCSECEAPGAGSE